MPTKEQYARDKNKYRVYFQTHYNKHKEEILSRAKTYRLANPEKVRGFRLMNKFKLSVDQYESLLLKQIGVCAICKQEDETGRRLAVDHNHKTGEIRGLLCGRCNKAIGLIDDSIERLDAMRGYLSVRG